MRKRDILHVLADKWRELPASKARALLMPVHGVHDETVLTYPEVTVRHTHAHTDRAPAVPHP